MAIEEVIKVDSAEQKMGAKGPYLEVAFTDKEGKPRKKNIFDQNLWNLFGEGLWVKWQLEKEGTWWNVKGAENVREAVEQKVIEGKTSKPTQEISGEEKGMWWKNITDLIVADKLEEVFGEKDTPIIKRAYKLQAIASLEIKAKKED